MQPLATSVIVDYQNMHLTAASLFNPGVAKHHSLLDPGRFARALIDARNGAQQPGQPMAQLHRVLVYRGLPLARHQPDAEARSQAQRTQWNTDPLVTVTYRPLKYYPLPDGSYRAQEKGIDVLCALAMVREAQDPDINLTILASHDTDLMPALDAALRIGSAKVETCCWKTATGKCHPIRPFSGRSIWNTWLDKSSFTASLDPIKY
jgi:uncharacterized LabA/DUF88 family protein